jgi:hypothetical protein
MRSSGRSLPPCRKFIRGAEATIEGAARCLGVALDRQAAYACLAVGIHNLFDPWKNCSAASLPRVDGSF